MEEEENNSCNIVGLVGVLIQVSLGVLSFSVLILKRCFEKPPRPWKIWIFDTSKQLISQLFAHFINLTISIALTYNDSTSDECLWYFTTNILDNTLGVLLCIFCLVYIQKRFSENGQSQYISGNYYFMQKVANRDNGCQTVHDNYKNYELRQEQNLQLEKWNHENDEPKASVLNQELDQTSTGKQNINLKQSTTEKIVEVCEDSPQTVQRFCVNYKAWLVQLGVWILIVILGKSVLFGIEIGLEDPLKNATLAMMGWIEQYELLQLFVVIVIVPVVMNGLAFWIQDNFLMGKQIVIDEKMQDLGDQNLKSDFKDEDIKEYSGDVVDSASSQINAQ